MASNRTCSFKHSTVHLPLKGLAIDKQYYLPSADLHFQVEQTIFRVHSYFFTRESPDFRERMAGVDCARSGAHDGLTDATAIPVKDATTEEFCHFLWVFYDQTYLYSAQATVWRVILTYSAPTRWDFPRIHALALHHLKDLSLSIVDRIVLYKDCSVPLDHLLPHLVEICTREEWLTLQESIRLGWELSVSIWQIRERLLRGEGKGGPNDEKIVCMGGTIDPVSKEQVQGLIKSTLNITQDASSVMELQDHHKCSPQHEAFDLLNLNPRAKPITKATQRGASRVSEVNLTETKGNTSRSKTQAINQVSKCVQNIVRSKGKSSVNA